MIKRFIIWVIEGYRNYISPMHTPCCRYNPTCSEYALTAVKTHGAFKGSLMALWRILRCNPFSKGGYDPVPLKENNKKE